MDLRAGSGRAAKRRGRVLGAFLAGALPLGAAAGAPAFSPAASEWLSVKDAPVFAGKVRDGARAADGTSWFYRAVTNRGDIASARWTVSGLGVFDVYANGARVGEDFLKPGFTHVKKTRYAFSYDVTPLLDRAKGAVNGFAAEVSAGWWRDKIVNFFGKKSAFRGELELVYADGSRETIGTRAAEWASGVAGAVRHAAIFDGEEYDARRKNPTDGTGLFPEKTEANTEFAGEVLPSVGAEVHLREDLARQPKEAYCWKGVMGADSNRFGRVVRTRVFQPGELLQVVPGETLVVDFGQNCAAVPRFTFRAAPGTTLTALPAEMLNDANGEKVRGNDGPAGSVYRLNLRCPNEGMRVVYTFGEGESAAPAVYMPRFSFFGYRYVSVTATAPVTIEKMESVPVTSIAKEMELGRLEVGDPSLDRFIRNVYWGQLSNYLSVPTDCPQRNERLGWSADTQVFCEAGAFNADTRRFFAKFTRDLRDSRCAEGGYPSVAPYAQYGNETFSLGWADVGVIVPWTIWKQFGDTEIVRANWSAMAKFVRKLDETRYNFEDKLNYIYADWLSYEKFETSGNKYGSWRNWQKDPDARNYRLFLAASYWLYDAQLMTEMSAAIGEDGTFYRESAARARAHIRANFLEADGLLLGPMRDLQTACVFALRFGIVEGAAKERTKKILLDSIAAHGGCLQTGFLGTGFLMDVLAQEGEWDAAYGLLLQHKNPSWLYSVDQGATTVWERWNSYTKKDGFGPVGMNSFNHYAYGAVLAWMYKHVAGIATDPATPGFKRLVLAPRPDRRLGFAKASYKSAAGLVASAWRYEGDMWIWDFTIPEGATAVVRPPDGSAAKTYGAGTHRLECRLP